MLYARQAIVTQYHGPTDTLPGRVIARCAAGKLTHEWDHALGSVENHAAAARALAERLGWTRLDAHIGQTFGGGYVVVFIDAPETRVLEGVKPAAEVS